MRSGLAWLLFLAGTFLGPAFARTWDPGWATLDTAPAIPMGVWSDAVWMVQERCDALGVARAEWTAYWSVETGTYDCAVQTQRWITANVTNVYVVTQQCIGYAELFRTTNVVDMDVVATISCLEALQKKAVELVPLFANHYPAVTNDGTYLSTWRAATNVWLPMHTVTGLFAQAGLTNAWSTNCTYSRWIVQPAVTQEIVLGELYFAPTGYAVVGISGTTSEVLNTIYTKAGPHAGSWKYQATNGACLFYHQASGNLVLSASGGVDGYPLYGIGSGTNIEQLFSDDLSWGVLTHYGLGWRHVSAPAVSARLLAHDAAGWCFSRRENLLPDGNAAWLQTNIYPEFILQAGRSTSTISSADLVVQGSWWEPDLQMESNHVEACESMRDNGPSVLGRRWTKVTNIIATNVVGTGITNGCVISLVYSSNALEFASPADDGGVVAGQRYAISFLELRAIVTQCVWSPARAIRYTNALEWSRESLSGPMLPHANCTKDICSTWDNQYGRSNNALPRCVAIAAYHYGGDEVYCYDEWNPARMQFCGNLAPSGLAGLGAFGGVEVPYEAEFWARSSWLSGTSTGEWEGMSAVRSYAEEPPPDGADVLWVSSTSSVSETYGIHNYAGLTFHGSESCRWTETDLIQDWTCRDASASDPGGEDTGIYYSDQNIGWHLDSVPISIIKWEFSYR